MLTGPIAIANAYCALEAGATHIDTSVLGYVSPLELQPVDRGTHS